LCRQGEQRHHAAGDVGDQELGARRARVERHGCAEIERQRTLHRELLPARGRHVDDRDAGVAHRHAGATLGEGQGRRGRGGRRRGGRRADRGRGRGRAGRAGRGRGRAGGTGRTRRGGGRGGAGRRGRGGHGRDGELDVVARPAGIGDLQRDGAPTTTG